MNREIPIERYVRRVVVQRGARRGSPTYPFCDWEVVTAPPFIPPRPLRVAAMAQLRQDPLMAYVVLYNSSTSVCLWNIVTRCTTVLSTGWLYPRAWAHPSIVIL